MSDAPPFSDLNPQSTSVPLNPSSPIPSTNGVDTSLNGGIDHSSPVSLPPNTPDVQTPDNVKINLDDAQQESDTRTEPVVAKEDPALPPAPPVVQEDVKMEELVKDEGEEKLQDHPMTETNGQLNGVEPPSFDPPTAFSPPEANGDHSDEPPTKRARKHSDADQASNHIATPPPPSASSSMVIDTPTPTQTSHSTDSISVQQYRHCLGIVRTLKKSKDAGPFLKPVDAVALAIPHYYAVITRPMDLGTVERKLMSSNPGKPDTNPSNPRYHSVDDFIADVRLIFSNSIAFNGEDHVVSIMGKRLEEQFDKQLKTMPGPDVKPPKPPAPKKTSSPPAAPPPKKSQPRRPSTSTPVQRKPDPDYGSGRPKRELHPQPSKEFAEPAKKVRKARAVRNDGTEEQFKFCAKVLQDLHKKQYYNIAYHFYEPVDWQRMGLPDYPKYVKKPMDLSTMKRKLENGEYSSPGRFHDDFKLMIRNCFNFNPVGTPVNQAGVELQRIFDEKWAQLPPLHDEEDDEEEEEEPDSDEEDKLRQIADMEREIEMMRNNIVALKGGFPTKQVKEKRRKEKPVKPPTPSTSKPPPKPAPPKPAPTKKKAAAAKKVTIADDDVLTFEQKKDLSEAITRLDGPKLERVIQIIHEGVPDLKNSNDEIELEVDLLPAAVLTKLFNFVIRPLKQAQAPKRNRGVKGTGTGGLKRKSMDEDVEAEKIRQLEERMALFDNPPAGDAPASAPAPAARSGALSDSDSSSDDSSGSESD